MSRRELRIVLLGEAGVGKSALAVRFITGRFLHKYDPTLEDEYRKEVEIDGQSYALTIVDTAGQEYTHLRYHFRSADVLLIAFSLDSAASLEAAVKIRQLANGYCGALSRIPAVLVGTKLDLDDTRAVRFEEGLAAAKELDCGYIETSAAGDRGVAKTFAKAVRLVPADSAEDSLGDLVSWPQLEKKSHRSPVKSVKGFLRRYSTLSFRWNSLELSRKYMRAVSE